MGKFKVGDKVRSLAYDTTHIVTHVSPSGCNIQVTGYLGWKPARRFKLVTPEPSATQKAMKLLIDQGYSIQPPKPKLSGKLYIYNSVGTVYGYPNKQGHEQPLAIVDWTEGDGL